MSDSEDRSRPDDFRPPGERSPSPDPSSAPAQPARSGPLPSQVPVGGDLVAQVLERHGVRFVFTLCGGHISPILVGAKARGIRVVDVRHEVTAVFAADAVARLTGVPGVAAVTAGPGVTNTVTALQNARMAESPLVLLGGATATMLKGRGSLQDIDQISLMEPLCKKTWSVSRVRDLPDTLEEAFRVAREGVPGPVFVEIPVDLLYSQELVEEWYGAKKGKSLTDKMLGAYLGFHAKRLFAGAEKVQPGLPEAVTPPQPEKKLVDWTARLLSRAERPVLVVGSGAVTEAGNAWEVAKAVTDLGLPTYLTGMARGLLGVGSPLQLRHGRTRALKEADLVILAGFPVDFRLDYGRKINRRAKLVSVGRDGALLQRNRTPDLAVPADPGVFLRALAAKAGPVREKAAAARAPWLDKLRKADRSRDEEIAAQAAEPVSDGSGLVNPLALFRTLEGMLPGAEGRGSREGSQGAGKGPGAILVADGGDFVATASYILWPRGPLSWLDPGPFGTLGVGAGFALGAALCRPEAQVWLIWGDGSAGYGLAEMDTFVRHGLPVIALVGNDAGWTQIAREQVEILEDDVGTVLARTDYHRAAEGLGARGLVLRDPGRTEEVLAAAQQAAAEGQPVLVNVHLGGTDFRKGSISM